MMATAQIELSPAQIAGLAELARETGKSQEDLLRDAVNSFLEEAGFDTIDWRAALRAGEGLWEHRTDLPDFDQLRAELDRDLWSK
jgi:hypothetical protein